MRKYLQFYLLILLVLGLCSPLLSQDEDGLEVISGAKDSETDQARELEELQESETTSFANARIGEWRRTTFISWTPHYFNITNRLGHKDSFTKRWFTGMTWLNLRWEEAFEYRWDTDVTLKIRPTLAAGLAVHSLRSHEDFRLRDVNDRVIVPATINHTTVHSDFGTQVGVQFGGWEPYFDYRSFYGFRFSQISAESESYVDPETGLVDRLRRRTVDPQDDVEVHSFGLGIAYNLPREPWNYRFAMKFMPYNSVRFKERRVDTPGLGFDIQANGWRLTDDVGFAFRFKWDILFNRGQLDGMHWIEIGVGIRFS